MCNFQRTNSLKGNSLNIVEEYKNFSQIEDLDKSSNWSQDHKTKKSSYKEHRVDALAPYAEEGRGKLRKATGSRKQAPIRRHPNGETRQVKSLSP